MPSDRLSDVPYVSLVDRLKSSARSSPKARPKDKDKENVDSSSGCPSSSRPAIARSPSLFIPSAPATFDTDRAKGKAREDAPASSRAVSNRSTSLARTVIALDSTSSVSDDDDFPVFISGHIHSSGSDQNSKVTERAGDASKAIYSRSPFNPLPTSSSTSISAGKDTTSSFFSPARARLKLPGSTGDGSSSRSSSSPKKSAPRTSSSSAGIIEISDSSNSFRASAPSVRGGTGPKTPMGQASSVVPPSSADAFWDRLSASELELLETGPSGPARSPRPAASSRGPTRCSVNLDHAHTMSITIEDDDDDDDDDIVVEDLDDDDIQDADDPSPFEEEPPPGFDHDPEDEAMERAFLNFEDDDDEVYTMLEEQALAGRARRAAASSSAGPSAPALGLDDYEPVPLQHTPLSALPEDVRRRFLEQFGKPGDEEAETTQQRSGRGGGARNSRHNSGGGFGDDDWNEEDDEDEEQREGFTSPAKRGRTASTSSSRGKARGGFSNAGRRAYWAKKAKAGSRRGSGGRGGKS
ncbi:hypothetical protein OC861_004856 [Tilletia horrida]|nr:hypothetical protein OC861_004856 [Tilletia horrida]